MDGTATAWTRRNTARSVLAEVSLERQELAARLRRLREEHDPPMNQEDAAHFVGVSVRQYVRIENEQASPHLSTLEKIATAYGIPSTDLTVDASTPARLTDDDIRRLETKLDRILGFVNVLAGAPEHELEDAVAAISSAIGAQAPPTDAPPPTAPGKPKRAQAKDRPRRARAAGKR